MQTRKYYFKAIFTVLMLVGLLAVAIPTVKASVGLTVCASGCDYTSIQTAIDAASDGATINVGAGTYAENYSSELALKINKSITLIGTGLPTVDGTSKGKVVQVTADNVTISGMRFVNAANGIGIYLFGVGVDYTSENVTISDCEISNNNIGLFLAGANGAIIDGNVFTDNSYRSIVIQQDSDNNVVKGNSITMSGTSTLDGILIGSDSGGNIIGTSDKPNTIILPISTTLEGGASHLPRAIYLSGVGASDNTIQYNIIDGSASAIQIDGNTGTTTVDHNTIGQTTPPSFRGVQINGGSLVMTNNTLMDSLRPVEFWGATNVTITGNTFSGSNFFGVNLGSYTGAPVVTGNKFLDFGGNGNVVWNQGSGAVDATSNWWGDIDPSDNVNNSGSGTLEYSPWCGDLDCTNKIWQVTPPMTIQAAIDAASAGDTIIVADGTYTYLTEGSPAPKGLIKVSKPLTIKAADDGNDIRPVIDGSGFDGIFKIWHSTFSGGEIIIEGFDLVGDPATGIAITAAMCDSADPTDIIIRDNLVHGMIGGINFWGTGFCEAGEGEYPRVEDVEISDNQFYDLGITSVQQGFGVLLEGLSSWSDAGNELAALVEGNTFANIYSKDGANVSVGVAINMPSDPLTGVANAQISDNTFDDVLGIDVALFTANVDDAQVIGNDFGNSAVGVYTLVGPVDASPNWWGSIHGPVAGQMVGNVTYDPWCGAADCSFLLSGNEDGDIVIPLGTSAEDIQDVIDSLSYGDTLVLPAGLIAPVGGFTINTPGITIVLQDGTEVQGSSPCFTVEASFTTIKAATIGGAQCIPTGNDNGIDVATGLVNITIEGLEFIGTDGTDGIHFAGAITDVVIVDNWFHDFPGDGIEFTIQPTGTVDIQGNLFQNNGGLGINASTFTLVAEYNAWGDYDGPAGTNGDGVSANVDATPWTHVDLYLESENPDVDNWLNQVFVGETITYNVKANLVNAMGAVFVLEYPSNLTIDSSALGGQFESELLDTSIAGKLTFTGYQTVDPAITGEDLTLFSVTFNAVTPDKDLVLNLDETTDTFSMAPAAGPSNNIYATALDDITSLDVISRPTLDIVGLDGPFVAGISHIITNETCNALTGGDWSESVAAPIEPDTIGWIRISDITIAEIASLEFLWGGDWYNFSVQDSVGGTAVQQDGDDVIARFGNYNFGMEVPVDWCDFDAFRVTFLNPGVHDVTVELYDMMDTPNDGIGLDDILLASFGPVAISIDGDFAITGTVSMQGRTNRAGVPMTLTKQGSPVYGPFNETSINVISNNISFTGVNGGIYEITTAQPRYLNVTADLDKQFLVNAAYQIDALELKGGNAVWSDNVINTGDASLVGTWYGQVIDNDADVNFSGKVDIFDLALVGGNFDLTSAMVYENWLVPEFNGTVAGVFDDDGANIWGSVSGDYNLSIDGHFTGGGSGFAYFTGTVSGDFSGTVTGAVYERGTDPLYAIITGTGAQETVRLVGAFVKSGIDGHFEGEIITGPELPAVTDVTITGPTTVAVGNTIDLDVTTTPADRWVIWSIHSNHTAYASIDQNGIVTGLQSFASPIEVIVVVIDDSGFSTKSYWVTVTE